MNDRFALDAWIVSPVPDSGNEAVRQPAEVVDEICEIEAVPEIKCPAGGRGYGDLNPIRQGFLRDDARVEVVIDREGHCSALLRSGSATGVKRSNPISKGNGGKDQVGVGTLGPGAPFDAAS